MGSSDAELPELTGLLFKAEKLYKFDGGGTTSFLAAGVGVCGGTSSLRTVVGDGAGVNGGAVGAVLDAIFAVAAVYTGGGASNVSVGGC